MYNVPSISAEQQSDPVIDTDRQRDRQTDRQTDRQIDTLLLTLSSIMFHHK